MQRRVYERYVVAVCCSAFQGVVVCCSAFQGVVVCCSVSVVCVFQYAETCVREIQVCVCMSMGALSSVWERDIDCSSHLNVYTYVL